MRQPATGITQNLGNRNRKKDQTAVRFSSVLWIFSVHRTEPANTTIKQSDAEVLDRLIIEKVHLALGFPFRPSSRIATLPLSLHGFDFPSIARINAGITVAGISRDLNHHIHSYRTMARITMADWTYEKNGCVYPLDGDGLLKGFSHYMRSISAGWIIAQKVMKDLPTPLSLRMTDQSSLAGGEVSLSHVVNICNHRNPQKFVDLNGNMLRLL
jgi:hypothetical protein